MKKYIVKRLLQLIPILIGITLLSFILMQASAMDAVDVMEQNTGGAMSEAEKAAARLSGSGTWKIIRKHMLPNIAGPVLVTGVLDIGTMMMEIAGLSFLGLGAVPPIAEWGSMMSSGRSMLQTSPWVILAPGFAIFFTVMLFNLLGDTVRDVMDPRRNKRQKRKGD